MPLTRPAQLTPVRTNVAYDAQSAPRSAPSAFGAHSSSAPNASSPSASSQPRLGWEPDVDPSIYEDETVAMTATELEAAADAKPFPPPAPFPLRSQPPPKPWLVPPPSSEPSKSSRPGATGYSASPPSSGSVPFSDPPSSGAIAVSPAVGSGHAFAVPQSHGYPAAPPMAAQHNYPAQHNYTAPGFQPTPGSPRAPSFGAPSFGAPPGAPSFRGSPGLSPQGASPLQPEHAATRAESWAIGGQAPHLANSSPSERLPPSARTWTSVEPHTLPRRENRWLFPLLLVTLGVGGLVLGGVLGKTWIAHLINPDASKEPAVVFDPSLPPFAPLKANETLEKARADAVHCLKADTPPLSGVLVARFNPKGVLEQLQMSGTLGSAPEAPCVRSVFEKVRVDAFGGPPAQVEKAIELRPQP